MSKKGLIYTFITLITAIAGLLILYFVGFAVTRQTVKISTRLCPPETLIYDSYFCQGVDLNNYTKENNQGLPNGFVTQFGPFNKYNLDANLELSIVAEEAGKTNFYANLSFYGSNDRSAWTKIGSYDKTTKLSFSADEEHSIVVMPRGNIIYNYIKVVVFSASSDAVKLSQTYVQTATNSESFGKIQVGCKVAFIVILILAAGIGAFYIDKNKVKVGKLPKICRSVVYMAFLLPLYITPFDLLAMEHTDQFMQIIAGFLKYGFIGVATTEVMSMFTYTISHLQSDSNYGFISENGTKKAKPWYAPPVLAKIVGAFTFGIMFSIDVINSCLIFDQVNKSAAITTVTVIACIYIAALIIMQVCLSYLLVRKSNALQSSFSVDCTTLESDHLAEDEPELLSTQAPKLRWQKGFLLFHAIFTPFFTVQLIAIVIEQIILITSTPNELKGFEMAFAAWMIVFIVLNWPVKDLPKRSAPTEAEKLNEVD